MDYQDELRIDRNALDEGLIQQPELFRQVAEEYAKAISVRDKLKEECDVVKAESELTIRKVLADDGEKVTEGIIKSKVEVNKKYRKAVTAWLDAKEYANLMEANKEAFQQRAFVLKDLCSLYIAEYFSKTSVQGGDATDIRQQKYETRRKEMAKQRRTL